MYSAIRNKVNSMEIWQYSHHDTLELPDALVEAVELEWLCCRDRADTAIGMIGRFMGKHRSKNYTLRTIWMVEHLLSCRLCAITMRVSVATLILRHKRAKVEVCGRFEQIRISPWSRQLWVRLWLLPLSSVTTAHHWFPPRVCDLWRLYSSTNCRKSYLWVQCCKKHFAIWANT
jgi:hypothetical protein